MQNGRPRIRLVHRWVEPTIIVDPVTMSFLTVPKRALSNGSSPCCHCKVSFRSNWTQVGPPVECEECFDGSNQQPLGET